MISDRLQVIFVRKVLLLEIFCTVSWSRLVFFVGVIFLLVPSPFWIELFVRKLFLLEGSWFCLEFFATVDSGLVMQSSWAALSD